MHGPAHGINPPARQRPAHSHLPVALREAAQTLALQALYNKRTALAQHDDEPRIRPGADNPLNAAQPRICQIQVEKHTWRDAVDSLKKYRPLLPETKMSA